MIILCDHHIWSSFMTVIHDDHINIWSSHNCIWSAFMIIIYDHTIRSSYMIIMHEHHIWSPYVLTISGLLWEALGEPKGPKSSWEAHCLCDVSELHNSIPIRGAIALFQGNPYFTRRFWRYHCVSIITYSNLSPAPIRGFHQSPPGPYTRPS